MEKEECGVIKNRKTINELDNNSAVSPFCLYKGFRKSEWADSSKDLKFSMENSLEPIQSKRCLSLVERMAQTIANHEAKYWLGKARLTQEEAHESHWA